MVRLNHRNKIHFETLENLKHTEIIVYAFVKSRQYKIPPVHLQCICKNVLLYYSCIPAM